jgi:uncharacterized DUF497 family protein
VEFDWDEANTSHIARHGVTPTETEESLLDPFSKDVDSWVEDDEVRYRQIGSTISGRLLAVAYTLRGDAVRPVTAFEPTRSEAKAYRHGSNG